MSKFVMPRKRKDLENMLVDAFALGMSCGYGVEHTELIKTDIEHFCKVK